MKKYTLGPWQYMVTRRHGDIVVASTSNGTVIVKTGRIDADDDCNNPECCKTVEHANAQRIVECVNAMEGIDNPMEFRMSVPQLLHDKIYFEQRCAKLQDQLNKLQACNNV